jgi:peptidoglycan/LPS O-acetylase OafA/YrhL
VLLVVLMHATGWLLPRGAVLPLDVSPAMAFLRDARAGVDIFFVLSGFLVSLPFVQAARGGRPVVLSDYFTRRALRILPLYATVVVVATVATSSRALDLVHGLPYLFFVNSVTIVRPMRRCSSTSRCRSSRWPSASAPGRAPSSSPPGRPRTSRI